jgi:SAM-dependent methyltransferase
MLCRWAQKYRISGVGVDISSVFLEAARARAQELDVTSQLTFVQEDAGKYRAEAQSFDVVSCIGATWIGSGLIGTLALMKPALKLGGLLLVGEPYWIDPPPDEAYKALGVGKNDYTSLDGTLDRFEQAGVELVEMVLANHDSWDRYEAAHWMALGDWLRDNPDDPDAPEIRNWVNENRRAYLKYERRYFGWGVFVLREA